MKEGTGDIGNVRWSTNQGIASAKLQATGTMPLKVIMDGLVAPGHTTQTVLDVEAEYETGFLGAFACKPTQGGSTLQVDIAAGSGLYSRVDMGEVDGIAGSAAGDPVVATDTAEDYRPNMILFALDAEETVTLGAHDATNPRIDVVYGIVSFVSDDPETIRVRPAGPGSSATSANVDQRITWTITLAVAAGTPAGSPAVPSIPAWALRIAHVHVPAASGAVTIKDARTLLRATGSPAAMIPDQNSAAGFSYARDVVAGLGVTAGATGDKIVIVASGHADVDGARRHITGGNVELDAAHATNPRWDLVWVKALRAPTSSVQVEIGFTTGTAAADPSRPSTPSNCIALAYVYRAANDNTVTDADIYDVRPTRAYTTGSHVDFTIPLVHFRVSVAAQPAPADPDEYRRTVTLTAYNQAGARHYGEVYLLAQTWGDSSTPRYIEDDHQSASITLRTNDVTAGTVTLTDTRAAVLRTDQFGKIEGLKVVDPTSGASGSGWLTVKPIRYLDASDDTGTQTDGSETYLCGSPEAVRVGFR